MGETSITVETVKAIDVELLLDKGDLERVEWIAMWAAGKDLWNSWVLKNDDAMVDVSRIDFSKFRELSESGVIDFSEYRFPTGGVDFTLAQFGDGAVSFEKARFGGGRVRFHRAQFGKGEVSFFNSQFGDGLVRAC